MSFNLDQQTVDDSKYYQVGSVKVSNPESTINRKQMEIIAKVDPDVTISASVLQTAQQINWTFKLPTDGTGCHYCDNHILEIPLINGDGVNAMNLVDGFSMIDYLETYVNDVVIRTQYGTVMRDHLILSNNNEKLTTKLSGVGIDSTTFAASLTMAAAGTTTLRIPFTSILNTAEVPLWNPNIRIKFVFSMRGGATLIRSGAAVIGSLTVDPANVRVVMTGHRLRPDVLQQHDYVAKMSAKTFRYLDQVRIGGPMSTIASTPTTFRLLFSGQLSHLFVRLTPAVPTGVQLYDSTAITKLEVLKSNTPVGSLLGDNGLTTAFLNNVADQWWANVNPLVQRPLYFFTFSENPIQDYKGANNGTLAVSGQDEQIRITSSVTDGTGQIEVVGLFQSYVTVDFMNGRVDVKRRPMY